MTNSRTSELQQLDKDNLWHPFTPLSIWNASDPLVVERGEGVYLFDSDDNKYIDGVSSLWCNVHGHNHPHINAAIEKQLGRVAHSTLLGMTNDLAIELAQKLIEITPETLTKVFYSDSGATSVEIALKMAFQYWRNLGQTDRKSFIAIKQSYHGDTMGSVSVGGISLFHQIFGPMTFPAYFTDGPDAYRFDGTPEECVAHCLNNLEDLLKQHASKVAAIVMEPLVQGAAGIIIHPEGFLKGARELADKYDVLLIVDEVATGFGRTGKMFACEHEGVKPDLMCMAKGITGGYLPLAATMAAEKIYETFLGEPWVEKTFYHGHTYTGNALACAAALANLDVFKNEQTLEKLPAKIALISDYLQRMDKLDHIGNVRQRGMIAAVEIVEDIASKTSFDYRRRLGAALCKKMLKRGAIMRPLSDVLVILPPLSIPENTLEELLTIVYDTLREDLPTLI